MKLINHISLSHDAWNAKSFEYQILSIASEFARMKSLLEKGMYKEVLSSVERAFELLDLTTYDPKWIPKLKELLRFREWLGNFYLSPDEYKDEFILLYKCLLQWHPKTSGVEI